MDGKGNPRDYTNVERFETVEIDFDWDEEDEE
jgi:hypothetical protein